MRGGALPAALLFAALGLLLAFAPRRAILPAILLASAAALAAGFAPLHGRAVEIAFVGCWASVILIAAGVHLPRGVPGWVALAAALDAGLWAGAVIAGEGMRSDLARAIPVALICLPASLAVTRGWQIAVKIVASWLVAIALLAALLPTTPTPGYKPDHMD